MTSYTTWADKETEQGPEDQIGAYMCFGNFIGEEVDNAGGIESAETCYCAGGG